MYTVDRLLCNSNLENVLFFSKEHLGQCAYKEEQCPNPGCTTKLLSRNVKKHLEHDCLYKKTACQWCGVLMPKVEQQVSKLGSWFLL